MTRHKTTTNCGWMAPLALILPLAFVGCQQAPSFSIAGSFFPDWILCSVVGILVSIAAHAFIVHLKLEKEIQPAVLIYPCILISCALSLWVVFFS